MSIFFIFKENSTNQSLNGIIGLRSKFIWHRITAIKFCENSIEISGSIKAHSFLLHVLVLVSLKILFFLNVILSACRRTATNKGGHLTLLRSTNNDQGTLQPELYLCLQKNMTWCILSVDITGSERQGFTIHSLRPEEKIYGRHWTTLCFHTRTSPKTVDEKNPCMAMLDTANITCQRKKLACLIYVSAVFAISSSVHHTFAKFTPRFRNNPLGNTDLVRGVVWTQLCEGICDGLLYLFCVEWSGSFQRKKRKMEVQQKRRSLGSRYVKCTKRIETFLVQVSNWEDRKRRQAVTGLYQMKNDVTS